MKPVASAVREHAFLQELPEAVREVLGGCARNVVFRPGELLTRHDEPAREFYLLRSGRVAVEIFVPARGRISIETLGEGDVVGLSWMAGASCWTFDSRATAETRAWGIDVGCISAKCEADPAFGHALMKRFSALLLGRLQATRLRLLDLYA
jgi:CRP-like cAMP-binding protein